jgi:hypothetical protein
MIPPKSLNVSDKHGGFCYLSRNGLDTVWRPARETSDLMTGERVDYDENSFYQNNNDVTRATYRLPRYGLRAVVWFDNATKERIA